MHDLFVLNREHDRNDSILKATNAAALAVIGGAVSAANAKIPLLTFAQSFGLIEGVNDAVAKSYLFEQIPGIIDDKVKQARLIYREVLEKSAKGSIVDEASSFRAIKQYLTLCLPQTIEGNFLQTYIAANPEVVPASGSTSPPPAKGAQKQSLIQARPPAAKTPQTLNFMVKPL
jgi:hypothetical protein